MNSLCVCCGISHSVNEQLTGRCWINRTKVMPSESYVSPSYVSQLVKDIETTKLNLNAALETAEQFRAKLEELRKELAAIYENNPHQARFSGEG